MRTRVLLATWLVIAATTTAAAWMIGGAGPGAIVGVAWLASGATMVVCLLTVARISRSRYADVIAARVEALDAIEGARADESAVAAQRHEAMLRRTGELAEALGSLRAREEGLSSPAPRDDRRS